ncbi:MAG: hypothetical protein B7Z37_14095 [Verrucomicrobia bacterium 12-59-8]|nr:MAG: hypothetical protein B7Z37_14095 [Verrucomicrobia bacterium 12-59-8]
MAKIRTPIPGATAANILFRSDRTCCICRERGIPTQIHHIDEDPSNNDPNNLALLCLHCHEETQISGGFGRKLDALQVVQFRNDWFERVQKRRDTADEIAAAKGAVPANKPSTKSVRRAELPNPQKLKNYILTLPAIRLDAYGRAQSLWDKGGTSTQRQGCYDVVDILEQILITLASWYPLHHFDGLAPEEYFNAMTASRFAWHHARMEPNGYGSAGTMARLFVADAVMNDLEKMVEKMVEPLSMHLEDFDDFQWMKAWKVNSDSSANEVVEFKDYPKRILGRWLGPRKYVIFFADGRWGVQRNEDDSIEIGERRWRIEGDKLFLTFPRGTGLSTSESTITSFTAKQFVTEDHSTKYEWAP